VDIALLPAIAAHRARMAADPLVQRIEALYS
jgi:hypothetical protein